MKLLFFFFVRYLLAPLLIALLLVVINNINSVKKSLSIKHIIIFILISGIIVALPSLFGLLRNEFVWGGLLLTIFSYLLLGFLFLLYSKTKQFQSLGLTASASKRAGKQEHKPAIFLLVSAVAVLGGWIYFLVFEWLSRLPYSSWAMFSVLWFLIPPLVAASQDYFLRIALPFYKPWDMSASSFDRSHWDNIDSFHSTKVGVRIKRKHNDKMFAALMVRMSDDISLGNWFNWFVDDQNRRFPQNTIDSEMNGENIGWVFYTSRWFRFPLFVRVLDPEKNRVENKIKSNRVIYIRRTKLKEDYINE